MLQNITGDRSAQAVPLTPPHSRAYYAPSGSSLPDKNTLLSDSGTLDVLKSYFPNYKKLRKKFASDNSKNLNIYPDNGKFLVKDYSGSEFDKPTDVLGVIQHYHRCSFLDASAILAMKLGYTSSSPEIPLVKLNRKEIVPEVELPQIFVPNAWMQAIKEDCTSAFFGFATGIGIKFSHLKKWDVGSEKGKTVFGLRNKEGKVVNLKFFSYLPTGKRDKSKFPYYLKQTDSGKYGQCLYGEHLLREGHQIVLVESEKTAILASYFYPQYDWVATGGAKRLKQNLKNLTGKSGFILIDADSAGRNESYDICKGAGLSFVPIDLFPEREDGYDLADAIAEGLRPNFEQIALNAIQKALMNNYTPNSFRGIKGVHLGESNKSETQYTIAPGQNLSDLNIGIKGSFYLHGGTGIGKTYFSIKTLIDSGDNGILLVPTTELAKQINKQHNLHVVMEGSYPNLDKIQVSTYDGIKKFLGLGNDVSQTVLYIDEAHLLSLQSSFREITSEIMDLAYRFKDIVLLTGTPIKSCHPILRNLPVIKINYELPPVKSFKIVKYKDRPSAILKRLKRKSLNTIVLQSVKKGQKLAKLLTKKGFKCQCFNRDTKNTQDHRKIIENLFVDDDVEVLIVTSLFFQGLNILNENVEDVHVLSPVSRYDLQQLYSRYRRSLPKELIIYQKIQIESDTPKANTYFNWDEAQHLLYCMAERKANHLNNELEIKKYYQKSIDVLSAKLIEREFLPLSSNLVRWNNGAYEVNYFGVDYETVQAETRAAYSDINLLKHLLGDYNFAFSGEENDEEESTEEDKNILAEISDSCNEQEAQELESEYTFLKSCSQNDLNGYADRAQLNIMRRNLAQRILFTQSYVEDAFALSSLDYSDRNWKTTRGKLLVLAIRSGREKEKGDSIDYKMIAKIEKSFTIGERLTPDEIFNRLKKILNRSIKTKGEIRTKTSATQRLKLFFEIKYKSGRNPDTNEPEKLYHIISNNPLNIKIKDQS